MGYTTWDDKTNDIIDTLHPKIRQDAINFINELDDKHGIKVRAYFGHRTFTKQQELYDKGRTPESMKKGEKVVTWAKPGQSYHNFALALDVVEILEGKAVWSNTRWSVIGKVGKKHGFAWGGDWAGKKSDRPHFQKTFGKHHTELLAMMNAGVMDGDHLKLA